MGSMAKTLNHNIGNIEKPRTTRTSLTKPQTKLHANLTSGLNGIVSPMYILLNCSLIPLVLPICFYQEAIM